MHRAVSAFLQHNIELLSGPFSFLLVHRGGLGWDFEGCGHLDFFSCFPHVADFLTLSQSVTLKRSLFFIPVRFTLSPERIHRHCGCGHSLALSDAHSKLGRVLEFH